MVGTARSTFDAHVHLGCADCVGGKERAVEHEVGSVRQQDLVLVAGWLAFGGVHDNDWATSSRDRGEFDGSRERGTSAATKSAALDLRDERSRRRRRGAVVRLVFA